MAMTSDHAAEEAAAIAALVAARRARLRSRRAEVVDKRPEPRRPALEQIDIVAVALAELSFQRPKG
jgi:hypothetical protein